MCGANSSSNMICAAGIWGLRTRLSVSLSHLYLPDSSGHVICGKCELIRKLRLAALCCLSVPSVLTLTIPTHCLPSVIAWGWPLLSPEAICNKGCMLLKLEKLSSLTDNSPISPAHRRHLMIPGDSVGPLAVIYLAGLSDLLNTLHYSGHRM